MMLRLPKFVFELVFVVVGRMCNLKEGPDIGGIVHLLAHASTQAEKLSMTFPDVEQVAFRCTYIRDWSTFDLLSMTSITCTAIPGVLHCFLHTQYIDACVLPRSCDCQAVIRTDSTKQKILRCSWCRGNA